MYTFVHIPFAQLDLEFQNNYWAPLFKYKESLGVTLEDTAEPKETANEPEEDEQEETIVAG